MHISVKTVVFFFVFVGLSSCVLPAAGYLVETDWANAIDDYAYQVDVSTSAEIVVCVFPSLSGHGINDAQGNEIHDIIQLGVQVFNDVPLETDAGTQSGIGKAGKDNGVLILIAIDEQEWRIEVGYGLEGDITDIQTNRIAQEILVPELKQGNYGEALYDTVVSIAQLIPNNTQTGSATPRGVYYYEADSTPETTPKAPWWSFITTDVYGFPLWLIIILALVGMIGVPIFGGGRGRSGRSGGGGSTGKW